MNDNFDEFKKALRRHVPHFPGLKKAVPDSANRDVVPLNQFNIGRGPLHPDDVLVMRSQNHAGMTLWTEKGSLTVSPSGLARINRGDAETRAHLERMGFREVDDAATKAIDGLDSGTLKLTSGAPQSKHDRMAEVLFNPRRLRKFVPPFFAGNQGDAK